MILEICASNYQSALNAQSANAHRIELCEKLNVGGVTPSEELLKQVAVNLTIETFILIRPRAGNFVYDHEEYEQMKQSIDLCKRLGFDGIVSGILNSDHTIDIHRTRELIEISKPLQFTFHRAFDEVADPFIALEHLVELKVDRVLTSGHQSTAEKGIELLKELNQIANNKIIILPGSGINPQNVILFKDAGFTEVHSSATRSSNHNNFIQDTMVSDPEIINSMLETIKV